MFHDRSLLGRCFRGFVLPVFEYCSAVWCSAVDTHLKLLDRAVSGARFLTGGVFECDIAHRRSVAVLCYCVCFVRSCVTLCTLLMMLYLTICASAGYTMCSGRTSVHLCTASLQNLAVQQDFYPLSMSLWNDLANPVFDGVGLARFKSRGRMHKTICGTLANSCCRNWTYGTLAQIMQCTEQSPLRFAILKVP